MHPTVLPATTIDDLAEATRRAISALQDPGSGDLVQKFKADPIAVIAQFGGPTSLLDSQAQSELRSALKALPVPDQAASHLLTAVNWACIGCEAGLNVVIVGAGGIVAIVVAVAAGPEALAASAVVAAIAGWTGLTASVVSGIIMGVAGGGAVVALEAVVAAVCQATGACA